MVSPLVLFLDEPTTGLDPRSRQQLWAVVKELEGAGDYDCADDAVFGRGRCVGRSDCCD